MVQEDPGSVEKVLSEAPKPWPIGGFLTVTSSWLWRYSLSRGRPPVSALHHRNVNKLLETLASRPCLFSWVEPWENTTLDSGLLCLFYVLSVRLLLQFSVYGWEDLCVYIWPLYIVKEKKGKLVLQHSELGYCQYRQKREDWFPALKKNKTKSYLFPNQSLSP